MRQLILAGVLLLCTVVAFPQQHDVKIDTLTIEKALAIALEHHPSLSAAEANVESAEAGVAQARSSYFPTINASATAQRNDGAFVFNPSFPPRNQTYNSFTTGFQFGLNVFDFGRTINRVSASSSFANASEYDVQSARGTVIVNVETAFFAYMQAQQVARVNVEAVRSAEEHLKESQAFYSVGKRAKFDVTRSEVALANANVAFISAKNQVRLAKVQLDDAMGIHPSASYAISDTFQIPLFTYSLDSAIAVTMAARPELASANARLEANNSLVSAAWAQNLPAISAAGGWTWSNFEPTPLFPRWNAGVTVSLPIFQGFAINAQVDQARANAKIAQANLDLLKQSVTLEVEQNYLSLKEADDRISASTKLVQQAEENLILAEKQYAAGVGTLLEVTDAQVSRSNAHITHIQALFDYNTSLIKLQRAMGLLGK